MKLCKDCQYSRGFWFDSELMVCRGPHIPTSPVNGKPIREFCRIQRSRSLKGYCGPEGKFWEPKKKRSLFSWLWE